MLIRFQHCNKSQLAGFFFLLFAIVACQPSPPSEQVLLQQALTDPLAAETLARRRLANDELTAALHWWQQAAKLGSSGALPHAIKLQQRLEGKLSTALWLEQHPSLLDSPYFTHDKLAELGFWHANPSVQGVTATGEQEVASQCYLTIQPVVTHAAGDQTWISLRQAWFADEQLKQLPVCFKPVIRMAATELRCTEQRSQRIDCDYPMLQSLVQNADFQQLLIIAGQGIASFNNGIIQLPENASLSLLKHEFLHVAGFLDEYALPANVARTVCQPGRISPNVIVGSDPITLQRYLTRYGQVLEQIDLTPVATCQRLGLQAFRPLAQSNSMSHFEAPLPEGYFKLLQQELAHSERLMPVQYYFAFLARQNESWLDWLALMNAAAELGYPEAIETLKQPAFAELKDLLKESEHLY